jgi:hypothetical protein
MKALKIIDNHYRSAVENSVTTIGFNYTSGMIVVVVLLVITAIL